MIRDLVRHGDRVTCAAAAVVAWLDRQSTPAVKGADAAYSSLHERLNDFQFKGQSNVLAALKVLAPREALYVATDAKDKAPFDGIAEAGHRVVTLEDALVAAASRRRNASLPRHVAVAANDVAMTEGEAAAVARIGANERGLRRCFSRVAGPHLHGHLVLDALDARAAHPRLRRPPGRVDLLLRTETVGRLPEVGGAAAAVVHA